MEFIDLGRQYEKVKDQMDRALAQVVSDRHFIMGPQVHELEEKLAAYTGRKYCLTCSSGTSALILPLMAYGLKKTDAVFVSSFTYFASAEAISLVGGTPVFVDSDETYNMDPKALEEAIAKVEKEGKLTPRGIVSVDIFGLLADYRRIEKIAKDHGLFLLTDSAQAFGAEQDGKKSCSFGDVSATSFFPAKPLGCYGDGGAIFTDDKELFELMDSLRVHGRGSSKYDNVRIGINGRLDTLQAAVLLVKLPLLDEELEKKRELAKRYSEKLRGGFTVPVIPEGNLTALAQYTIMANDEKERDQVVATMKDHGVPTMIYYRNPMHMQKAFADLGYQPENLPVSYDMSRRVLSLPMHAYMTDEEFETITDTLLDAVR